MSIKCPQCKGVGCTHCENGFIPVGSIWRGHDSLSNMTYHCMLSKGGQWVSWSPSNGRWEASMGFKPEARIKEMEDVKVISVFQVTWEEMAEQLQEALGGVIFEVFWSVADNQYIGKVDKYKLTGPPAKTPDLALQGVLEATLNAVEGKPRIFT